MAPAAPMPACMLWRRSPMLISIASGSPASLRNAINAHLRPNPVSVFLPTAGDDFHARFSAMRRRYLYRIVTRDAPLALDRDRAWWLPAELDAAAMHDAARLCSATMISRPFEAADCQANRPQDPRPPRRRSRRRPDRDPRRSALLPSPSGPLDGRVLEARRRGQSGRARSRRRACRRRSQPLRTGRSGPRALSRECRLRADDPGKPEIEYELNADKGRGNRPSGFQSS